ncbi:hypothetical protein [Sinorhizobium fredii]|uniref:hypothetical protein n=1 Tax=Rhizobium fredii TaxID=380 RepID=UPI0004AFD1CB|nr:hypothetical protein [Sinorhizobium fredii]
MAEKNEHIAGLEELRAVLVASRRNSVTSHNSSRVMELQAQIEAVDRAIADEKNLQPKRGGEVDIQGFF